MASKSAEEKILELDESIQGLCRAAIELMLKDEKLRALGVDGIYINEARRSLAVQMAYYSRGRMDVEDVKKMYAAAGLYRISSSEAAVKNTNTLFSKHIQGLAFDVVPMNDGILWWNAPASVWERIGEIGESVGLEWGGRWTLLRDYPHFQRKETL